MQGQRGEGVLVMGALRERERERSLVWHLTG